VATRHPPPGKPGETKAAASRRTPKCHFFCGVVSAPPYMPPNNQGAEIIRR